MLTKETALTLRHGQILRHITITQDKGKALFRVRVSGKCLTWKTRPNEFRIPVKQGLYNSGSITHENAGEWVLEG